jgi:CHAT domain-containing protein
MSFIPRFKYACAVLAFTLCGTLANAQSNFRAHDRLQLRQETYIASEPETQSAPDAPLLAAGTPVEVVDYRGEWHHVRDRQNHFGWVRSRVLEPEGSCSRDEGEQFLFLAKHFGFVAYDERFEEIGMPHRTARTMARNPRESHRSHTELSLRMGLARYGPGTAALLYYYGHQATCVLLVDRTGVLAYAVRMTSGSEVEQFVTNTLRSMVSEECLWSRAPVKRSEASTLAHVTRGDECKYELDKAYDDTHAKTLARLLFPTEIEQALAGVQNIIIVPYGMIAIAPFAALELPRMPGYFIDKFAYTIAPAFTQIGIGRGLHIARKTASARPTAVVVGNPAYNDAEWIMKNLEGAEAEANSVARILGVHPLIGAAATTANIHAQFDRASQTDIAYFATHGIASDDNPSAVLRDRSSQSFIALANGERLSISSLDKTGYRGSRLVVLSACLTGRGWIAESGNVGLPQLFQLHGAEEVVMSLWMVDDRATRILMEAFITEYAKTWPKSAAANALRDASIATRASFPKPAFWAAFSVFGVGPFN